MRRRGHALLGRVVDVQVSEFRALLLACAYGFAIFTAYAIIRPMRDAMALAGGVRDLPWLFGATLVAMLVAHPFYSSLVSRWPRRIFVGFTSRFFAVNLGIFFVLGLILEGTAELWLARVFFVWTSVFNLFVLSIFWSFLADLFTVEQARRLFGLIAVGITMGGIVGAGLTSVLSDRLDPLFLLPVSMVLLEIAARMAGSLCSDRSAQAKGTLNEGGLGGSMGEGITTVVRSPYLLGIASFKVLYTVVSPTARYKAKNFIDTTIYRAGDQIGAWSWALMGLLGLGALTSAWVAAPLSAVWLMLGIWLGRRCAHRS